MRNFPAQYNLQDNDALYFSHIPKTAGMTFRTIVEDQFQAEEICPATLNAQVKKLPPETLEKYRLYRGHLGFINLPKLVPGKKIVNVTVLREPVARVISHYEYIRRMPNDPHYRVVKDMTLEEFAQKLTAGKVGKNIQTYHVAKTLRFDLDNFTPAEILELAKQSLDQFAFVGLVERFQDSLFLLSYIFGWKPIINTRKENAAKSKKSLNEIPASTIEVIKANSLLDTELYEYAREIFEARFDAMVQELRDRYAKECGITLPAEATSFNTDQFAVLLDRHYQQRYIDLGKSIPNSYVYDFCLPLTGTGWQRREMPAEMPAYRWIGPGTEATLDLPLKATAKDTDFLMEFRTICSEVTPPDILNSLKVEVNGKPLEATILYSDKGTRFFQAVVPGTALDANRPFARCTFRVNRVTSLNELNPLDPDTRPVGLALNFVQIFPIEWRGQSSALIYFFDCKNWQTTLDFLQKYLEPGEPVVAPLIFKAKLENPVQNHARFLKSSESDWVVIHKGRTDRINAVLSQLFLRGFSPVFANEVFVIYSRKPLPKLAYLSEHVKPLYADRIKQSISQTVKPLYRKVKNRMQN